MSSTSAAAAALCAPGEHKVAWGGGGVVERGILTTGEGMLRLDRHVSVLDGDGGADSMSLVPGVETPPTEPDKDVELGGHGGAEPVSLASAAETTSTQPAVDVDGCATLGAQLLTAPRWWLTPKKDPLAPLVATLALMMPVSSTVIPPRGGTGPSDASAGRAAAAGTEGTNSASLAASLADRLTVPPALPPDWLIRWAAAVAPAASS